MTGERNTWQKQAVYGALVELGHPTATEVYERVSAERPSISRGTVFRVLGVFAETGRAKRLYLAGSDDRFDACVAPHAHTRCRVCGRLSDIPMPKERELYCACGDFRAEGCEIVFYGVCADCAEK